MSRHQQQPQRVSLTEQQQPVQHGNLDTKNNQDQYGFEKGGHIPLTQSMPHGYCAQANDDVADGSGVRARDSAMHQYTRS